MKEAWFSMGLIFGDIKKLLQELARSYTKPATTIGIEGYQSFIEPGNIGYALVAATKPGGQICSR